MRYLAMRDADGAAVNRELAAIHAAISRPDRSGLAYWAV